MEFYRMLTKSCALLLLQLACSKNTIRIFGKLFDMYSDKASVTQLIHRLHNHTFQIKMAHWNQSLFTIFSFEKLKF